MTQEHRIDGLADFDIAARTVIGEANNQPFDGKKAVVHVLMNRAFAAATWLAVHGNEEVTQHPLYGDGTLKGAAQKSNTVRRPDRTLLTIHQFSCWNTFDPVFTRIMGAATDSTSYKGAILAVEAAIEEEDITGGATHYHTRGMNPYPSWTQRQKSGRMARVTCTIGDHIFYRDVP